jgi:hypothetical protein
MPTPEELATDATVEAYEATPGLTVLVSKYAELKSQLDAIEVHRKEVQAEFDKLRKEYLPHALTDYGVTSARTPLGTISVRTKTHAAVPANRRDEARRWLIESDYAHMLTLEPAAALTLANAFIADGDPVPDFIRLFHEEVAVLTRKKE